MRFSSGLPETACGRGSTLKVTAHLRAAFPSLLRNLGITSLIDAPCGDFNWMSTVDLSEIDYIGVDNDKEHLKLAAENQRLIPDGERPKSVTLIDADIVDSNWRFPKVDALLCRDFLQHIPNETVKQFLRSFLDSGIELFLATSHESGKADDIPRIGGFRPLDLTAKEIGLVAPTIYVEDPPDSGRILGVWNTDQIKAATILA